MDFNEMLVGITGEVSGFLYTYILLVLLVFVGVYFTIRTKGVQIVKHRMSSTANRMPSPRLPSAFSM